jgi:hypothetical protein
MLFWSLLLVCWMFGRGRLGLTAYAASNIACAAAGVRLSGGPWSRSATGAPPRCCDSA